MNANTIATLTESLNAATTAAAIKTIATDAGLPVPVATSAAKAREELLNHIATLDVTPDPQQETAEELELRLANEKVAAEAKAEADKLAAQVLTPAEILAGLDAAMVPLPGEKSGGDFLNKEIIAGQTAEIILLLNKFLVPIRMQRVGKGPSDHAAFHYIFKGKPMHGFLTKAEYNMISGTKKVCDIPPMEEIVDKYHNFMDESADPETKVVAAVRLRMGLTSGGAVKAA